MQKLVILDSETGICHIFNMESDDYMDEDIENIVESKGFNVNSCQWMVALEVIMSN